MSHQDWNTISIINPEKQKQKLVKDIIQKKGDTSNNDFLKKIENDTETLSHVRIPSLLIKEIVAARVAKKLSQKDLANKLNMQLNVYTELESGKAIYSSATKQDIQKIERTLGIQFCKKSLAST
jgi:putative transcription factor